MSRGEVLARRFGPKFARPCADETTTECALWECQIRNRCQKSFNLPDGAENDMHRLTAKYF